MADMATCSVIEWPRQRRLDTAIIQAGCGKLNPHYAPILTFMSINCNAEGFICLDTESELWSGKYEKEKVC